MKNLIRQLSILYLISSPTLLAGQEGRLYPSFNLTSSEISSITQDRYGYIWIGTQYGLNRFDGYRFQHYYYSSNDSSSISDNNISALYCDADGTLHAGTSKGLSRYDMEKDRFSRIIFDTNTQPHVVSMTMMNDSSIMCGTAGYGLYNIKGDSCEYVSQYDPAGSSNPYNYIICYDKQGRFWRSDNLSVARCYARFGATTRLVATYESKLGKIIAILPQDPQHIIIVCQQGVVKYDGMEFKDMCLNLPEKTELSAALLNNGNELILGTVGNGLISCNLESMTCRDIRWNVANTDLKTSHITALFKDRDGNIWLGSQNRGLIEIDGSGLPFKVWTFSGNGYVTSCQITSMAETNHNSMFVTLKDNGLFEISEGKIKAHITEPSEINYVYCDDSEQHWITARGKLYRYDYTTRKSTYMTDYPEGNISAMCCDHEGRLYVSSFGNGLMIYDPKTGKSRQISMFDKKDNIFTDSLDLLCNDWITSLVCDSRGMIWCGTAAGVSCYNPNTNSFLHYKWNGLLKHTKCNTICEDRYGNMLLGTDIGLYRYDVGNDSLILAPNSEPLIDKPICTIVNDQSGHIWISTKQGIWRPNKERTTFKPYSQSLGLKGYEYTKGIGGQLPNGYVFFGQGDGFVYFDSKSVREYSKQINRLKLSGILTDGEQPSGDTDFNYREAFAGNRITISESTKAIDLCFSSFQFPEANAIELQYRIDDGQWQSNTPGNNIITLRNMQQGRYDLTVKGNLLGSSSDETHYELIIEGQWHASTWMLIALAALAAAAIIAIVVITRSHSTKQQKKAVVATETTETPEGKQPTDEGGKEAKNAKTQKDQLRSKPAVPSQELILIVDNDTDIINNIATELSAYYNVKTCSNGREAMEILLKDSDSINLVITETSLPETDGITLLKNIKTNVRLLHLPVIMMTKKAGADGRLEGLRHGADAFINKPFLFDELLLNIDAQISNMRRRKSKFSGIFEPNNPELEENVYRSAKTDTRLLERIVEHCNKNMSNSEFDVDQLCTEVGISRSQLHRKMKELTGIGTGEFIRNLRLEQAARLLKEKQLNVSEVAYAVGFVNLGHFSKIFRLHFGVAPSQYHDRFDKEKMQPQESEDSNEQ